MDGWARAAAAAATAHSHSLLAHARRPEAPTRAHTQDLVVNKLIRMGLLSVHM